MNIKIEDRVGQKFNRLTVLSVFSAAVKDSEGKWIQARLLCRCDCGNIKDIGACNVVSGGVKSCGRCVGRGKSTRGVSRDPLYKTWIGIRLRTLDPTYRDYPRYGGRGIGMEPEWAKDFPAFRLWVLENLGEKPTPQHTIDRADNSKGYIKHNLRWSTKSEQQNNRRGNRVITFLGITATMKQHCERLSLRYDTVRGRLLSGWTPEQAFCVPVDGKWHSRDEYEEPAEELETA